MTTHRSEQLVSQLIHRAGAEMAQQDWAHWDELTPTEADEEQLAALEDALLAGIQQKAEQLCAAACSIGTASGHGTSDRDRVLVTSGSIARLEKVDETLEAALACLGGH